MAELEHLLDEASVRVYWILFFGDAQWYVMKALRGARVHPSQAHWLSNPFAVEEDF